MCGMVGGAHMVGIVVARRVSFAQKTAEGHLATAVLRTRPPQMSWTSIQGHVDSRKDNLRLRVVMQECRTRISYKSLEQNGPEKSGALQEFLASVSRVFCMYLCVCFKHLVRYTGVLSSMQGCVKIRQSTNQACHNLSVQRGCSEKGPCKSAKNDVQKCLLHFGAWFLPVAGQMCITHRTKTIDYHPSSMPPISVLTQHFLSITLRLFSIPPKRRGFLFPHFFPERDAVRACVFQPV